MSSLYQVQRHIKTHDDSILHDDSNSSSIPSATAYTDADLKKSKWMKRMQKAGDVLLLRNKQYVLKQLGEGNYNTKSCCYKLKTDDGTQYFVKIFEDSKRKPTKISKKLYTNKTLQCKMKQYLLIPAFKPQKTPLDAHTYEVVVYPFIEHCNLQDITLKALRANYINPSYHLTHPHKRPHANGYKARMLKRFEQCVKIAIAMKDGGNGYVDMNISPDNFIITTNIRNAVTAIPDKEWGRITDAKDAILLKTDHASMMQWKNKFDNVDKPMNDAFRAPEVNRQGDNGEFDAFDVEKANVYQYGATFVYILYGQLKHLDKDGYVSWKSLPPRGNGDWMDTEWSPDYIDLAWLQHCLDSKPNERPTYDDLLRNIQKELRLFERPAGPQRIRNTFGSRQQSRFGSRGRQGGKAINANFFNRQRRRFDCKGGGAITTHLFDQQRQMPAKLQPAPNPSIITNQPHRPDQPPRVARGSGIYFADTESTNEKDEDDIRQSVVPSPLNGNDGSPGTICVPSKVVQTQNEFETKAKDIDGDAHDRDNTENRNQTYDDTTHGNMHTHVLTLSEPHHIHIVSDAIQSTPIVNANPPIDLTDITEEELTNIVDCVEMDILAERMLQYFNNFMAQVDGMIQCSNQTDADYNAAFACDNGRRSNSSQRNRANHKTNRNHRGFDDKKQNDDRDDKKYDPDGAYHTLSHGCNHLRECSECAVMFTRKCEHIKLLTQLLHTHQQQIEAFSNMFCQAIKSRNGKSKKIFKSNSNSTVFNSITTSKTKCDLYPSYRAKKNIKLSRKMTQIIIPNAIPKAISNAYAFMEKSIGMQYNDGQIQHTTSTEYQVLNCDLYDQYQTPLYCVMKRMPISNANYKYQIEDRLFTASQATQLCGGSLPCSSRAPLQRMSAQYDIKQFTFDSQFVRRIIKRCKWNTIHVFKRKENKKRLTLTMTQEQLNPMIKRCMLSIKNDKTPLIPILMFDNTSNTHWIEYILVVHVEDDIDIGISLIYDATYGVQITGIHLDKVMILEQHEVLLSHSQHDNGACHCLDGFTSIIHDMRVGNCEALLNEMKSYKQKYGVYKQLAHKFINGKDTEKYSILQQYAEMAVQRDNGSLGDSLFPDSPPTSTDSTSTRSSSPSSPDVSLYPI